MRWIVVTCLVVSLAPAIAQGPKPSASYDALVAKARTLILEKKPQEAVVVSEQAIALNEKRWEAYVTAASAYSTQRLYDDTISMLQMALGRPPEEKKPAIRQAIAEARRQISGQSTSAGANSPLPPPVSATVPPAAPTQAEVVLWKSIENSNRVEDYRGYLAGYPNGVYAGLANSRIEAIEWKGIESTQNQDDLRTYLQTYPNGPHALAATNLLQSLRWTAIEKSTNPADFRIFMREFPNSTYAMLASNRIEELDWLNVSQSKQPADYKAYIESHPDGQYVSAAQKQYADLINQANEAEKKKEEAQTAEEERMRNGWDFKWSRLYHDPWTLGDAYYEPGTMTVSPQGLKWKEDKLGSSHNFTATCSEVKYDVGVQDDVREVVIYVKGSKATFAGDDGITQFLKGFARFCQH